MFNPALSPERNAFLDMVQRMVTPDVDDQMAKRGVYAEVGSDERVEATMTMMICDAVHGCKHGLNYCWEAVKKGLLPDADYCVIKAMYDDEKVTGTLSNGRMLKRQLCKPMRGNRSAYYFE